MLTELLKKQEGDVIPQGSHSLYIRENKDDVWERTVKNCETIGTKSKN